MSPEQEMSDLDRKYVAQLEAEAAQAVATFPAKWAEACQNRTPDWKIRLKASERVRDLSIPGCVSEDFDRGYSGTIAAASPFGENAQLEDWKQ